MLDEPVIKRALDQSEAKPQASMFVIAPLDTPAEDLEHAKKDEAAEKQRQEKIEKEVCRAVEDAVEKSV
jgi:hypothetical protein